MVSVPTLVQGGNHSSWQLSHFWHGWLAWTWLPRISALSIFSFHVATSTWPCTQQMLKYRLIELTFFKDWGQSILSKSIHPFTYSFTQSIFIRHLLNLLSGRHGDWYSRHGRDQSRQNLHLHVVSLLVGEGDETITKATNELGKRYAQMAIDAVEKSKEGRFREQSSRRNVQF